MKPAHIIAIVVIAVCLVVSLFSLGQSIAPHVTMAQAMSAPKGDTVQVPGAIDQRTVRFDAIRGSLVFDILACDRAGKVLSPEQRMTVVYHEPKPENFDTATSVEAIGRYSGGVFNAERLLVKCPSKYSDEKPANKQASAIGPTEIILGAAALSAVAVVTGFAVRNRMGSHSPSDDGGRSV